MKKKNLLMTAIAIFGLSTITMAQVPSYVPTSGLVGWWPFNGNATDESPNNNDGSVNGATLTNDRNGNNNAAYSFNGSNNYISMLSMNSIPLGNNSRTISVWMNPSSLSNQWTLTAIGYGSPSTNNAFMFGLGNNIISAQGWAVDYSAPLTYNIGQWLHAVCTYDGLNVKIYVDGVLIGTGTISTWNTLGTEFYFGTRPSQGNSFFHGNLDDIGIWNRVLTQQEITNLYSSSNVGISEVNQSNLFSVFPNPIQNVINVKADIKLICEIYSIYDNNGKLVLTGKLNSQNTTIELGNLSGGIYMFSVGENMKQTFKVIKE